MAEYYNFSEEQPVTMEIEETKPEVEDIEEVPIKLVEEEVFDKKPKRTLTDKQKQALQAGRAKAKAQREAKRKEEVKKEIEKTQKKTSMKQERQQIIKAEEEAVEQIKTKRQKKTAQEKARERIKARKAERDKQDDKKIDEFNEFKYSCLEHCETEEDFDKLDNILNKYITRSDILKGNEHIKNKIGEVVSLLKK